MKLMTRKHPVIGFVGWICFTVFVSLSCWLDLFIGFEMLGFDGLRLKALIQTGGAASSWLEFGTKRYRDARRDVEGGKFAH